MQNLIIQILKLIKTIETLNTYVLYSSMFNNFLIISSKCPNIYKEELAKS